MATVLHDPINQHVDLEQKKKEEVIKVHWELHLLDLFYSIGFVM